MNTNDERIECSFYFASSRTKDWERGSLIAAGWFCTAEDRRAMMQGMAAAACRIGGYAHGTVKAYSGDRLISTRRF